MPRTRSLEVVLDGKQQVQVSRIRSPASSDTYSITGLNATTGAGVNSRRGRSVFHHWSRRCKIDNRCGRHVFDLQHGQR